MVRRDVGNTRRERTLTGCEWRDKERGVYSCDGSPLLGAPAVNMSGTNPLTLEVCSLGVNTEQASRPPKGSKSQKSKADKKYLGVRVKMPVRDMLRNIRIAKGMDPKDLQKKDNMGSKGDKKRVNMSGDRRNRLKKWQTKSLEELAIIMEVLEEDLKTSTTRQPSKHPSSNSFPELGNKFWCKNVTHHEQINESPSPPSCCSAIENSPTQSMEIYDYLPCSVYSQATSPCSDIQDGYSSGEPDYYTDRSYDEMTCSPSPSEWQAQSPDRSYYYNPKMDHWWGSTPKIKSQTYACSVEEGWDSMTYFWTQMEREEHLLNSISDQEFLAVDEHGRTLLHRAVNEGKRALVYVIAKRMADLKKLDSKDKEGKTALHLAAEKNQHLMVADLIAIGANINERTNYRKTCLHLSAENGYIRVLEVLKSYMKSGTYIDLEARDVNGLSALQVASLALKSTVGELERSVTVGQARLHSLRKEQMMETLKCLLQMECNLQSLKPAGFSLTKHEIKGPPPSDFNTGNEDVKLY